MTVIHDFSHTLLGSTSVCYLPNYMVISDSRQLNFRKKGFCLFEFKAALQATDPSSEDPLSRTPPERSSTARRINQVVDPSEPTSRSGPVTTSRHRGLDRLSVLADVGAKLPIEMIPRSMILTF